MMFGIFLYLESIACTFEMNIVGGGGSAAISGPAWLARKSKMTSSSLGMVRYGFLWLSGF